MNDPSTLPAMPAPINLSVEEALPPPPPADLEQRVERLEEEVAALKDTKAVEERIAQRVTERLQKTANSSQFAATPLPVASVARATPFLDESPPPSKGLRRPCLLTSVLSDARLCCRMLLDKRYPKSWTTHAVLWLLIPAILTSGWWFPLGWLPFLGTFLDKAFDVVLAFGVYKALSRETRRYREILEHRR
jgi:hypothetical protein